MYLTSSSYFLVCCLPLPPHILFSTRMISRFCVTIFYKEIQLWLMLHTPLLISESCGSPDTWHLLFNLRRHFQGEKNDKDMYNIWQILTTKSTFLYVIIQAIKWNKVIYHSQVQLILTDMTWASDTVIKHQRIGWSINACPKVLSGGTKLLWCAHMT